MCKYCDNALEKINKKYPHCDWNCDEACNMWSKLSWDIPDANIEFEDGSNENYACTCPACGNMVCGWCV